MAQPVHRAEQREAIREFVTMALYISLSLLAVVIATPAADTAAHEELAATVFLTSLGLLVAHVLAFALSSRLVSRGRLDKEARRILAGQAAAGLSVAIIATVPLILFNPPIGSTVSEVLLIAFVAVVGYAAVRQSEVSRIRAVIYVGFVIVAAAGVLAVKFLTH